MFRRRCLLRTLILLLSIGSISSSDENASLLAFKRSVVSDPAGTLTSWSDNPLSDPCFWSGITCDSRSRVSKIEIPQTPPKSCPNFDLFCSRRGLVGRIAPEIGNLTALRVISLPWNGFEGGLPEEIVRLGSLEVVDLTGNKLSGEIPRRFGRRIRVLRLGFNEFEGGIPAEGLVDCVGLESLDLSRNKLNGSVPGVLFRRFSKLKEVLLGFNRLSGAIPPEGVGIIGSGYCVSLERISLEGNLLTGSIPVSFGSCRELRSLVLSSNLLEDVVPKELGRLRKLRVLDVSRNSLSGPLPAELGNCLELSVLVLSNAYDLVVVSDGENDNGHIDEFNFFQGGIPENITSLPQLRILWAPRAMLEGEIPSDWGSCKSLEMVNLGENLFTGEIPKAFGQCGNLKHLNLSSNKLTGWLPDELSVPCMDVFDVSGNQLSGLIPRFSYNECSTATSSRLQSDDLSSAYYSFFKRSAQSKILSNLLIGPLADDFVMSIHDFGRNNFSGSFPSLPISPERLGNRTLYALFVDGNGITGTFPGSFFEKCENVNGLILNISGNMIYGVLPTDIDVLCRPLMVLDASSNRISGTIPQQLGQMRSLVSIDLSGNRLYGQIPWSFGLLKGLKRLALAANNLTGDIPSGLSKLSSLQVLDLSSNSLSGEIPTALLKQGSLAILFLNNNKLSGRIPASLANNTSLSLFNVSFNNLSGPIPVNGVAVRCDSAIGNPMLEACHMASLSVPPLDAQSRGEESLPYTASPPGSSPGNGAEFTSIEIASIASATAIVSVLLALIVLYVYTRKCAPRSAIQNTGRKELTVFTDIGVPLTYESVVRATGGFNASNCIGSGGFGATYKAEIAPGVVVAVKRLSVGRIAGVQQFHAEVKTLGRWRHQNLVTLIGFHVSEAEMFLIYNYLPGGNLETFIQERSQRPVDWRMLHKIALDVARALAYLHENCVPRILHRDVKPSNILLDNDYNAYLSDFGLARLLGNSETHATTGVAGTFGYVAPEYAMTCRVSDKADVYSYGVVLLELISNKKALDPSFSPYGNGFNIVAWAHRLLSKGRAHEFFTEGLWDVGPHDDLVDTLHLAITCTDDSLSTRPTMKHVVQRLKQIQPPICSPLTHYTS